MTDSTQSDSSQSHSLEHREDRRPAYPWSPSVRLWLSIALAVHLFLVVLAPLGTVPPRSQLAVQTQRFFAPYSEALFLQHGYRFFAPEPGPSHLVKYKIHNTDGSVTEGQFPDRNSHSPRLLYHRWFMLSETLALHVGETLGPRQLAQLQQEIREEITQLSESDPRLAQRLESELRLQLDEHQRMADVRDRLVTDIGQWLLQQHEGASSVDLKMWTRVLPPPQDIERGLKIDADLYLPENLTVDLGTVTLGVDELENISPEEVDSGEASVPTPDGSIEQQGRGVQQ